MILVSAPLKFMSATLQPQVENFRNESRKFGSGCEYAMLSFQDDFSGSLGVLGDQPYCVSGYEEGHYGLKNH